MKQPSSTPDPAQFKVNGHLPASVHVYCSGLGIPLGAAARFEPGTVEPDKKSFRMFRCEGDEWRMGLGDVELPLYRLPEVLAAQINGDRVFVVEGEKCADALHALGLVATTNACGAGHWLDSHTKMLTNGVAVLIQDNDDPGRKHMQKVAAALRGVAKSIRLLDPPGLDVHRDDQGWDVADWLAEGGTREALLQLVDAAPQWTPPASASTDWPTPLPFANASEPSPFPLGAALPSELGELAAAIAETVMVDEVAPAALIPAVLSCAAGNAFSVQVSPGYREPNLARFTCWCKPSGERGSETFRRVTAPLDAWTEAAMPGFREKCKAAAADATFYRKRAEQIEGKAAKSKDGSVEELRREAREARLKIPEMPVRPVLSVGDCTSESFVRVMAAQGGACALFSSDARHCADEILGRYRRDGKTDDSVYLRAHGGDTIDRSRVGADSKGEYIRIPRPSLAVAICLQPDKFDELAGKPELLTSGFLPRCNLILPRSRVGSRFETGNEKPLDPMLASEWEMCARRIVDRRFEIVAKAGDEGLTPDLLCLGDEAMHLRRAFANELERRQAPDGDLRELSAFASKCAGETARLAALFHLAVLAAQGRLRDAATVPITAETWNIAETHQRWQLEETLRVLALAREDQMSRAARRLLAWCVREPQKRRVLKPHDVLSSRIVASSADATSLLMWLAERGWVRRTEPDGKKGSPSWEVHPSVFPKGGPS